VHLPLRGAYAASPLTFMQIDVRGEVSGRTIATCGTTYLTAPMERVGDDKG
jgi:hypothetical protein